MTSGANITISPDAAGAGWFVDPTPTDSSEFTQVVASTELDATATSPAFGKVDLLTTVIHEMGHVLGLPDVPNAAEPNDVMDLTLATGVRRMPQASDLQALQPISVAQSSSTPSGSTITDPGTIAAISSSASAASSPVATSPVSTPATLGTSTSVPMAAFGEPLMLAPASGPLGPLSDGSFNQGSDNLAGWLTSDPQYVTVNASHQAVISESSSNQEVDLYQDFLIPQGATALTFTVDGFTFDGSVPPGGTPDAFGVSLLDPTTQKPLLSTVDRHTDSYFTEDVVPGATAYEASGVTLAPGATPGSERITVDVSSLQGHGGRLVFRFLGGSDASQLNGSVTVSDVTFGGSATLSGQVFQDSNGNGLTEAGEPGLAGQTVFLDANNNGTLDPGETSTQTASDGSFAFNGLFAGTYQVAQVVPTGWAQTTSSPAAVILADGASAAVPAFGTFQLVNVQGTVFNDANGNGSRDAAEAGLSGVSLQLVNGSGQVAARTTTAADGSYQFTDVGPGIFSVEQTVPAGWEQTAPVAPATHTFTTSSGASETGQDFGDFQAVTLSGTVFNDANGNGAREGSDAGLSGWTVQLLNTSGTVVASSTTGTDGSYQLTGVGPGAYTVQTVLPSGWVETSPASSTGYPLTTESGTNVGGQDFGVFQLVSVSGQVFNDLNGDGSLSQGEPGLSGWSVQLLNSSGQQVARANTDAGGSFTFSGVGPGSYTIQPVLPTGWVQTLPAASAGIPFTAQSGTNLAGQAFGMFQQVSLSGQVFNDVNGNGAKDSGDAGLSGRAVQLVNSAGQVVASTTTAADGSYQLADVGPGSFVIQAPVPTGWMTTLPGAGSYGLSTHSGTNLVGEDFGAFQLITLGGTVFNDLNDNHTQDAGEAGLSGWVVQLDGGVAKVTTNASGAYSFTGVGPGPHSVRVTVPTGFVETAPSSGGYTVTASSGTNLPAENFAAAAPTRAVDSSQGGYTEKGGGWQNLASGWLGSSRTHAADPTGASSATWYLTITNGLPVGRYELFATYVAGPGRGTNVPYKIYDGTTLIATVTINQTQAPSDAQYQGLTWKSLGVFSITTGRAYVILGASANGSVDADGVLLIAAGSPQMLEGAAPTGLPAATPLTDEHLQEAVAEARAWWLATGLSPTQQAALAQAQVSLADLRGGEVGLTVGQQVWIDRSAGGVGWFIDPTPGDNQEFVSGATGAMLAVAGGAAASREDLLTVVAHELGHILGLADVDNATHPNDLMDERLAPGVRRLPPTAILPGTHETALLPVTAEAVPAGPPTAANRQPVAAWVGPPIVSALDPTATRGGPGASSPAERVNGHFTLSPSEADAFFTGYVGDMDYNQNPWIDVLAQDQSARRRRQ